MNPLVRGGADRDTWGRYDVAGHRTIYAADPRAAAYAESLAAQRVSESLSTKTLSDIFSAATGKEGLPTLLDMVKEEWAERHHMQPQQIAAGWRLERREYELQLPTNGWFVEVETADSISALSAGIAPYLVERGILQLTVGHLKAEDRALTTTVAGWVREQVLDDGSLPHGIIYDSKHSKGWGCWAIWLRAVDDGKGIDSEPTKVISEGAIGPSHKNAELERIEKLFNIRVN